MKLITNLKRFYDPPKFGWKLNVEENKKGVYVERRNAKGINTENEMSES